MVTCNVCDSPVKRKSFLGFSPGHAQANLLSYRDSLENSNFTCSKLRYDTFQTVNSKGAD